MDPCGLLVLAAIGMVVGAQHKVGAIPPTLLIWSVWAQASPLPRAQRAQELDCRRAGLRARLSGTLLMAVQLLSAGAELEGSRGAPPATASTPRPQLASVNQYRQVSHRISAARYAW